jgi:copper chaperone CopZ
MADMARSASVPFSKPWTSKRKEKITRTTFEIKGMHCEGCETRIKMALRQFPAISAMQVDHRRGLVAIEHQDVDIEAVGMAIARLGFSVTQT